MVKIKVAYDTKQNQYYIDEEEYPFGSCSAKEMFESLSGKIKEEVTLMGVKDGFTITIEKGGEK